MTKQIGSELSDEIITLEPANSENVDILVKWSLDPVAQGPYKRVPSMTHDEMRNQFLNSSDRWYFLIKRSSENHPLGRFYYRAWNFSNDPTKIDWELNIFIADPAERGKGYGTVSQRLAVDFLRKLEVTRSIFAYTFTTNEAEQRALMKIGFENRGLLPSQYYNVKLPPEPSVLFVLEEI
jgi:RimJ/RimL family protein N-acetyltransferase